MKYSDMTWSRSSCSRSAVAQRDGCTRQSSYHAGAAVALLVVVVVVSPPRAAQAGARDAKRLTWVPSGAKLLVDWRTNASNSERAAICSFCGRPSQSTSRCIMLVNSTTGASLAVVLAVVLAVALALALLAALAPALLVLLAAAAGGGPSGETRT